jgi:hypothetical protein
MAGLSPGLHEVIDTLSRAGDRRKCSSLRMLDAGNGVARLRFISGYRRREMGAIYSWLAVIRIQSVPAPDTSVLWLLDARSADWARCTPPAILYRGRTGLAGETAPLIWFHASDGQELAHGGTAPGIFGAAGIADAAIIVVTRLRVSRQIRLDLDLDPRMWDLAAAPEGGWADADAGPRLTISATGFPRPLELSTIRCWL